MTRVVHVQREHGVAMNWLHDSSAMPLKGAAVFMRSDGTATAHFADGVAFGQCIRSLSFGTKAEAHEDFRQRYECPRDEAPPTLVPEWESGLAEKRAALADGRRAVQRCADWHATYRAALTGLYARGVIHDGDSVHEMASRAATIAHGALPKEQA